MFYGTSRINRVSLAIILGLLVGWICALFSDLPETSSFLRGDFPAFYAAGEIVRLGRFEELYDYELQSAIENREWPSFDGGHYIFPYPPFVALLFAPFTFFSSGVAKALASGFMLACILVAWRLAQSYSEFFRKQALFVLCFLLSFIPAAISVVGVQNTALSLLILSAFRWAIFQKRETLAGFFAAMLLFKPQYGVLFAVYLAFQARKKVCVGWLLGLGVLYSLCVPFFGWNWPTWWLAEAGRFGDINFTINLSRMASVSSFFYWLGDLFASGSAWLPIGYITSAALFAWLLWNQRKQASFLAVITCILLCSPQTLFYDVGIAVFFLLATLDHQHRRSYLTLGSIWIYCFLTFLLHDSIYFPLSFPALVGVLVLAIRSRQLNDSPFGSL